MSQHLYTRLGIFAAISVVILQTSDKIITKFCKIFFSLEIVFKWQCVFIFTTLLQSTSLLLHQPPENSRKKDLV